MIPKEFTCTDAIFSDDRIYRYVLTRRWGLGAAGLFDVLPDRGTCCFIMLNPSTADEMKLDPTVRRCVGYANDWGFRSLVVLNLFAWRSTDKSVLPKLAAPVGAMNDHHIALVAKSADFVVCGWGNSGKLADRGEKVKAFLQAQGVTLHHLGLNDDGTPQHPLYLPKARRPTVWL